jgi:hypothetical protein
MHHSPAWFRDRFRKLRNGQLLPSKPSVFSGELPWTRWCLNSWDWRCSGFASSCSLFPRAGGPPSGRATSDPKNNHHFQVSISHIGRMPGERRHQAEMQGLNSSQDP